jgi:esterase/lipase
MLVLSYIIPTWKLINFPIDNLKLSEYRESKKKCKYYNKEPIMICTGRECYKTIVHIKKNSYLFNTPVLAIHARNDKIVNYSDTKIFIDNCISDDKKMLLFNRGEHNLLVPTSIDDIKPNIVFNYICNWLNERIV